MLEIIARVLAKLCDFWDYIGEKVSGIEIELAELVKQKRMKQ